MRAAPSAPSVSSRVRMAPGSPSKRPRDRVTLHVGGQTFVTSRTTLTSASSYFSRLLSTEWEHGEQGAEPIFLDRDADAFCILLSYMRCGHATVLPEATELFARVMLDA